MPSLVSEVNLLLDRGSHGWPAVYGSALELKPRLSSAVLDQCSPQVLVYLVALNVSNSQP